MVALLIVGSVCCLVLWRAGPSIFKEIRCKIFGVKPEGDAQDCGNLRTRTPSRLLAAIATMQRGGAESTNCRILAWPAESAASREPSSACRCSCCPSTANRVGLGRLLRGHGEDVEGHAPIGRQNPITCLNRSCRPPFSRSSQGASAHASGSLWTHNIPPPEPRRQ